MQLNETDRQQFVKLVEEHQGILHRICLVYASQPADRQDLFQDIVLQLWRSFGSFRAQSCFTTWMYRVALNTALLQRRKASRRPDLTRGGEAEIASLPAAAAGADDGAELLRTCIRELPTLDRAIVLLHLEERRYEEIAEITGLSRSNVSVRLVRLKEALRRMMEEKGLGREALV